MVRAKLFNTSFAFEDKKQQQQPFFIAAVKVLLTSGLISPIHCTARDERDCGNRILQ